MWLMATYCRQQLTISRTGKDDLADHRWKKETAGFTFPDGVTVRTDRESQSQIANAYSTLKNGLIPSTRFKAARRLGHSDV